MLDGSRGDEANIGNVENNNPAAPTPGGDGVNTGGKARQALLKKGGRKLRSAAPLHHQKPPRSGPGVRLADHNNNNNNGGGGAAPTASSANRAAAQPGTELPAGTQTVLTLHHLRQGARREVSSRCGAAIGGGAAAPRSLESEPTAGSGCRRTGPLTSAVSLRLLPFNHDII